MRHQSSILAAALASLALLAASAAADPPILGDLRFLPGDAETAAAVQVQDWVQLAPGGPGYLAVWQDSRSNLSGATSSPNDTLAGNSADIYAARLDADGNLLDPHPIVIANHGRDQTRPQAAWNGSSWLVVWTSERPDWYFFEDIVGVRVSAAGTVLDPEPIPIRLENPDQTNDHGVAPHVASDGSGWLVVWQDQEWVPNPPLPPQRFPTVEGRRVAADGTLLDAETVVLHQHSVPAFGPRTPRAVWAAGQYLVVWGGGEPASVVGKRFDAALQPIDSAPFAIDEFGVNPRVATDGSGFFVVTSIAFGHRVTAGGQVLDPLGIDFSVPGSEIANPGPDVAWNGNEWTVALAARPSGSDDRDLFLARIAADGTVLGGGPQLLLVSPEHDFDPAIASRGDGRSQVAWTQWDVPFVHREDLWTLQVDAAGNPGPAADLSTGLHRQSRLRFAGSGDAHLAVFTSEGGSENRILAQRIDPLGEPIDAEPVLVAAYPEMTGLVPDVAWNGDLYLVAWRLEGEVVAQRLGADLTLIDPVPVQLAADNAIELAVGALGDTFLVAYTREFSVDQRNLKAFRVGADMVADPPAVIGGGYALAPDVGTLGGEWLVVWERQPNHDILSSNVSGVLVDAAGAAGSSFLIDEAGDADDPAVATAGDRALVVWYDNTVRADPRIEGRLIDAGGIFAGPEFLIADPPLDQYYPAAGWTGDAFLTAWIDYRGLGDVDQLRGDVYAARVELDGTVLDPEGFQLTSGPLPEDLPAVAGGAGVGIVGFSQLHGPVSPEVQRLGTRTVTAPAANFLILPTPAAQAICAGDGATVDLAVPSFNGFSEPVTLALTGNPPGATAGFSVNPVTPPGASVLAIGATGGVAPGTYAMTITGTASPSGIVHQGVSELSVLATTLAAPVLLSPADGATGVSPTPVVSWTPSPGASSYHLEVDDDADFASPVFTADVVTTAATVTGLAVGTHYFWRVTASNLCAASTSAVFEFTTALFVCRTPNLPIPDNDLDGVTDTLVMPPGGGTLADLDLSIVMSHTWVGDVTFTLRHDGDTPVTVIDRPGVPATALGCSGNDVDVLLDDEASLPVEDQCNVLEPPAIAGTFRPNELLAAYDGQPLSGTWTLHVSDAVLNDFGTLVEWCLSPALAVDEGLLFADGFESGDAGAWSAAVP